MIKIDICDDEPIWIDKAREVIGNKINCNQEIVLNSFSDSKGFVKKLLDKQEYSDIVILDIDMPGMNGFDVAIRIRNQYPDIILIFYTSHEQYVFESFQFQPFRFVRKAFADVDLEVAINAAIQSIEGKNERSVVLKSYDEISRISIKNIVCFEVEKRRCNVYLNDGKVLSIRKTIRELFEEINSDDFIMLHSGAVANIRYIRNYSSHDVTMESGIKLMVSRSHIKNVKSAILSYWGDNL